MFLQVHLLVGNRNKVVIVVLVLELQVPLLENLSFASGCQSQEFGRDQGELVAAAEFQGRRVAGGQFQVLIIRLIRGRPVVIGCGG